MMKAIRRWRLFLPMLAIFFGSIACLAYADNATVPPIPEALPIPGASPIPEASPIPFKRESPTEEVGLSRFVIGFGVTILALAVSLYFLRRRLQTNNGEMPGAKQIRVLETRRLTPRSTLFVVEFAGSRYLIAESGQGVSCMGIAPSQTTSNMGRTQ